MATITLKQTTFGCTIGMGAFEGIGVAFSSLKQSANNLTEALGSLKAKIGLASIGVNVSESQEQTKAAQEREKIKKSSLSLAYDKLSTLISDVGSVDIKASSKIRERKETFYDRYYYLKPECEKTKKEQRRDDWNEFKSSIANKVSDFLSEAWDWLKANWKELLTVLATVIVVVVIVVVSVMTFGGAAVAIAALVGGLLSVAGQLVSDVITYMATGKWSSSPLDYFGAFVGGAIGGILMINPAGAGAGAIVGKVFGKASVSLAVNALVSTSLTENLENIFGLENRSYGQIFLDTCESVAIAFVLGKIFEGPTKLITTKLADKFANIPSISRLVGSHSYAADFSRQITRAANKQVPFALDIFKRYSTTFRNGFLSGNINSFLENIGQGGVKILKEAMNN